ncbi:hypothetical protein LJB86_01560 [Deltaproteobacteria bacterium OttesenSCG-928-M10]|nr:hypothetical protein [Deltaproteobacteria bacterium OttesenSCG-928-M10]
MTIEHTYLLRPGLWDISGIYFDKNNSGFPQKGQLVITHEPDLWTIEARLTITTEQTQTVDSRYDVQPLTEGLTFTEWKSETGGPEPVYGLFVIVGDTVMSPWQSRSGTYWGQEILVRESADEYQGRGFAFLNNEKVSAWVTRMTFNG